MKDSTIEFSVESSDSFYNLHAIKYLLFIIFNIIVIKLYYTFSSFLPCILWKEVTSCSPPFYGLGDLST